MREHGGDLDAAIAAFGGAPEDWLDLSTGINPRAYPPPEIAARSWRALPTGAEINALSEAAARAYGAAAPIAPLAGAQAAIQLAPRLRPTGLARVLGPTYNEHAASFAAAGWRVETHGALDALSGADVAVVVNPNNPDGQAHRPEDLIALAAQVGLLVVDESFVDPTPELSLVGRAEVALGKLLVLRSFGKFYGLAGLRLGFAIGAADDMAALRRMAGPWAVSGPAIAVGCAALSDTAWRRETIVRLADDAARLDALASAAGWRVLGGTSLFRLYETPDAAAAQTQLARGRVWSRIFPYSQTWLRLGLPDGAASWDQFEAALRGG